MSFARYQVGEELRIQADNQPADLSEGSTPHGLGQSNFKSGATYSLNGDQAKVETFQRVQTANERHDPTGLNPRTAWGSPVSFADLKSDTIVTIGGMETTVAVAERLGYITRNAPVQAPVQAPSEAPSPNPSEAPEGDPGERLADAQAEGDLGSIIGSVSPGVQVRALRQVAETGAVDKWTMNAAASEMGIEPSALEGRMGTVIAAFEAQATKAVEAAGVPDPDAFYAWAEEHHKAALSEAIKKHGMDRTTAGYRALATEYVASLGENDAEAVLGATFGSGITARKNGMGQVVLTIPGTGEMSYRDAVKSGVIKVSKA